MWRLFEIELVLFNQTQQKREEGYFNAIWKLARRLNTSKKKSMLLKILHVKRFNSSGTYTSDVLNYLYEFGITEFLFISLPLQYLRKCLLLAESKGQISGKCNFQVSPWNAKEDAGSGPWYWVYRRYSIQWFWENAEIRSQIAGNK